MVDYYLELPATASTSSDVTNQSLVIGTTVTDALNNLIGGGGGGVVTLSIASSNGFAGSSSGGVTPVLTLSTSVTGVLKGNGTAISAATSGTDYAPGTSALATGLLKSTTTTGALSIAASGTDYAPGTSGLATGILKSTTTTGVLSIAAAGDFPTLNQNTSGTAAGLSSTLVIGSGGTGQTTKAAAFDALQPMTTGGDIIYGGASGTGTRLANGTAGQALRSAGTTAAPTWSSVLACTYAEYEYNTTAGFGSSATKIPYFTNNNTSTDTSSLLTISNGSTNGLTVTANRRCKVHITFVYAITGGGAPFGITKNNSSTTTSLSSIAITTASVLVRSSSNYTQYYSSISCRTVCEVNDVIRPHTDGTVTAYGASQFLIFAEEIY